MNNPITPGFKKIPPGPPPGPPPSKMIAAFAASIAAKQLETPGQSPGLLSQKNQKEEKIRDNIQETQIKQQPPQPSDEPPLSQKEVANAKQYISETPIGQQSPYILNLLGKSSLKGLQPSASGKSSPSGTSGIKQQQPPSFKPSVSKKKEIVINTKISEQNLSKKMKIFNQTIEKNKKERDKLKKQENRLQEEEERLRKEKNKLEEEDDRLKEEEYKLIKEEEKLRKENKLIQNKTSNSNQEKLNYIIDKEEIIDIKKSKYFTELKELQNKLSFKLSSKLLNKAELIIRELEENKQKLDQEYENIIKYNNIMNGKANIFNTQSYIINKNIQTINKDFINDIISNYSDAYKASLNNYKKLIKVENKHKQKLDYIFNL